MSAIILIPAFLSCWIVARKSASAAFFDVWFPCLMLLPMYFDFRIPHVPPVMFTDTACLPILVVMLVLYLREWVWRPMDWFILAFVLLMFASEAKHTNLNTAGLDLFDGICTCMFPYMAGRVFLEKPGKRGLFLQRFLLLLCLITILSVWDFVGGTSIFQRFFSIFFPGQPIEWPVQMRYGFGRIAGPYAQAILCGMMFLTGILLSTGMRHFAPHWGTRRVVAAWPLTLRGLVTILLVLGLLMTQSRGPIFGAIIGLMIVQIARAYNTRRATIVVTIIILVGMAFGYGFIREYTAGGIGDAKTLEQQNAIYRKQLLPAYQDIMIEGGLLGWGITDYPKAIDQDSIDNEYLLLAVTQGYLGLALFVVISFLTIWDLYRMLPFATGPPDKWLLFTLLSIFVGLLLTLTTVFLGMQVYVLFFLLVGWVQALRTPILVRLQQERKSPKPLVKVYT